MKIISNLKKFLMLPTVVDLGWSTMNALPLRRFQSNLDPNEKTWEDYHELMKTQHPVKYFLFETVRHWLAVHLFMPLDDLKYYVRDFIFRRTHLLDLRQQSWVPGCDDYSWGYSDPRESMLYACMNLLDRFVKETDAKKKLEWLESELAASEPDSCERGIFADSVSLYREALLIHKWWHCDRKSEFLRLTRRDDYSTTEATRGSLAKWDEYEEKEEEMLQRLLKIRRGLWS